MDGGQHRLNLDFGQMPKVVFEHALFVGHLRTGLEVLDFATTAGA